MKELPIRLVAMLARAPGTVLALVVLTTAIGAGFAVGLKPTAGLETFLSRSDPVVEATERYYSRFGDEPVIVLVEEQLTELALTSDLGRMIGLEGCLSGKVPKGAVPPGGNDGPCAQLAKEESVRVVYGPGTFINESVRQLSVGFQARRSERAKEAERAATAARRLAKARGKSVAEQRRLAREARRIVYAKFVRDALQLAIRYGIGPSLPSVDDPRFVSQLIFDSKKKPGTPKSRFAYLFPSRSAALIQVRLKPGLDRQQRQKTVALIGDVVAMPQWRLDGGGTYTVTGVPVALDALTTAAADETVKLLLIALAVMGAVLLFVGVGRPRLLPLAVAIWVTCVVFGLLDLFGGTLTPSVVAALPVLIGLAVDYAIQVQARVSEQDRASRVHGSEYASALVAIRPLTVACVATTASFVGLLLSPTPLVKGFALLLVVGVPSALLCALVVVVSWRELSLRRHRFSQTQLTVRAGFARLLPSWLVASGKGAQELLAGLHLALRRLWNTVAQRLSLRHLKSATHTGVRRYLTFAGRNCRTVLLVSLLLSLAGWVLLTRSEVTSDVRQLVPREHPALNDLQRLERAAGTAGEVDVFVEGSDLSRPEVVRWLTRYRTRVLSLAGFRNGRECRVAKLCPAFSYSDLFRSRASRSSSSRTARTLAAIPPYFAGSVITTDRKAAVLRFGLGLLPLDQQQQLFAQMRRTLDPPAGVRAEIVGLPVVAAKAGDLLSDPGRRVAGSLVALLAVFLVLALALKGLFRAVWVVIPVAVAVGWAGLMTWLSGVALNPLSLALSSLVVAVTTQFSVLLSERFRRELETGDGRLAAAERTYRSTGRAVVASAVTAIFGFGVLAASELPMLREFGLITVVDLLAALLVVVLVLPAVWAYRVRADLSDTFS